MMKKGTILLVEDNEDDIFLAKRALEKKKISNPLVIAEDGEEAINLLFGLDGRDTIEPILILLDLKIPKIGGLEVLQRIKTNSATSMIPVVILTTSSEEEDVAKSYKIGANSYVRKPVDFVQFSKIIEQLGMYWLVLNENLESNSQ